MSENRRRTDWMKLVISILLGLLLSAYAYFGLEAKADIRRLEEIKVDKDSFSIMCEKVNNIDKKTDAILMQLGERK